MPIKRFDLERCRDCGGGILYEIAGGDYVESESYDDLLRLKDDLARSLESVAKTAHYRTSEHCFGDFEECSNCLKWRTLIEKAEAFDAS